jgi:GntR family transcriptional regulator/MocR family aminotransferase
MKRSTSAPELLIHLNRSDRRSLRLQLERELRRAIQTGRLPSGSALPASRTLADDLHLSRGVVVEAYEQLRSEGYLTAAAGSATRVAARRATISAPAARARTSIAYRYDFRPGLPDVSLFPRRAWLTAVSRSLSRASSEALDYPPPEGVESAREVLSEYLNRARATASTPARLVVCSGSAQAVSLLCRVLRDHGVRELAVEDPGHTDQCTDIQAMGLSTPRIPVDNQGLSVDILESTRAGAVLVTPAHQYPMGSVLAPERRAALLEWAARRRALVIEDDYDAEYRYDREPVGALQGLAPDLVAYVGSASKVLSPALRLGWLLVPPALAEAVGRAKAGADRGSAALEQLAFADFVERGSFDRHIRRTRRVYRRRRDLLVSALEAHLPRSTLRGVAAGLHVLMELEAGIDEAAVIRLAAGRDIRVYGASAYRATPAAGAPALVLGYGNLQEEDIVPGVRQLADVVDECRPRRKQHRGRPERVRSARPAQSAH